MLYIVFIAKSIIITEGIVINKCEVKALLLRIAVTHVLSVLIIL